MLDWILRLLTDISDDVVIHKFHVELVDIGKVFHFGDERVRVELHADVGPTTIDIERVLELQRAINLLRSLL